MYFDTGNQHLMLVKMTYDQNNKITQKCIMDDRDCERLASSANMRFESIIDIFYDKHFKFNEYQTNAKAADQLKAFYTTENN